MWLFKYLMSAYIGCILVSVSTEQLSLSTKEWVLSDWLFVALTKDVVNVNINRVNICFYNDPIQIFKKMIEKKSN